MSTPTPTSSNQTFPDGSKLTVINDPEILFKVLPGHFQEQAAGLEARALQSFLEHPGRCGIACLDLRDMPIPAVLAYYAGNPDPAENGAQLSIAMGTIATDFLALMLYGMVAGDEKGNAEIHLYRCGTTVVRRRVINRINAAIKEQHLHP